jgi:hypothetical protein
VFTPRGFFIVTTIAGAKNCTHHNLPALQGTPTMFNPLKTKTGWIILFSLIVAGIFVANFNPASLVGSQQKKNDALIAEQMAYHIGVLAYLYGYPIVDMHKQMHNETHQVAPGQVGSTSARNH